MRGWWAREYRNGRNLRSYKLQIQNTPNVTLRVPLQHGAPFESTGSDNDSASDAGDAEDFYIAARRSQSVQRNPFRELSQNNVCASRVHNNQHVTVMQNMENQPNANLSQVITNDCDLACETEPKTSSDPWNADYESEAGPPLVHWNDMVKYIDKENSVYDLTKHETNILWTFANEVNISFVRGSGCHRMLGVKQNTKKPHLRCVLYLHVLESLKTDDAGNATALSTVQMLFGGKLKEGWGQIFQKRLTGSNMYHKRVLIGPAEDTVWSFCPKDISFYALKLRNKEISSLQAAVAVNGNQARPSSPRSLSPNGTDFSQFWSMILTSEASF